MERTIAEIAAAHEERVAALPNDEAAFYVSFREDLSDRVTAASADATPLMIGCTALLATDIVRLNADIVAAGRTTLKNSYLFVGMVETLVRSLHTIGPAVVANSKAEIVASLALKRSELWTSALETVGSA